MLTSSSHRIASEPLATRPIRGVCFDVGGTLVRNPEGPATYELARIVGASVDEMRTFLNGDAKRRRTPPRAVADAIAGAFGRPAAADTLVAVLERARRQAARPTLYPDARPTLALLRRRGFRLLLLTNVLGAIAPARGGPLDRLVDTTILSCDTGFVKPEREAFEVAARAVGLDPENLVHVGDSAGADVGGALDAGCGAVHVTRGEASSADGDGGAPSVADLRELAALLPTGPQGNRVSAPPELPPLEAGPDEWIETAGELAPVGGRTLMLLPFAAPVGRSRGRRYTVAVGGQPPRGRVILSARHRAALVPPPGLGTADGPVPVRIKAYRARRERTLPRELESALAERGLTGDQVSETELRQLLRMVSESSTPAIRRARVEAAVAAIEDASRAR